MDTHLPPIGDALEGSPSSHLHPSGCRGVGIRHRVEPQSERFR